MTDHWVETCTVRLHQRMLYIRTCLNEQIRWDAHCKSSVLWIQTNNYAIDWLCGSQLGSDSKVKSQVIRHPNYISGSWVIEIQEESVMCDLDIDNNLKIQTWISNVRRKLKLREEAEADLNAWGGSLGQTEIRPQRLWDGRGQYGECGASGCAPGPPLHYRRFHAVLCQQHGEKRKRGLGQMVTTG